MNTPRARHPLLLQINTRVVLGELGRALGRAATLDDLPDRALDDAAEAGFAWIWLLGVWRIGAASREVSRTDPAIRAEVAAELPGGTEADIGGSPFAIAEYAVAPELGGNEALARIRRRMASRGLRLVLDFVVNHTAIDHGWVEEHPEYYVQGGPEDLAREPRNYREVASRGERIILAHGRDPYFPGWPDTLQINFRHPAAREAVVRQLERVADLCDGVRCDMAMLVQPDVFERTWGDKARPADGTPPVSERLWAGAIERVRAAHPGFLFMAEVYWDREWELQQEGFDFTYDKRLYDRLRAGSGRSVREHLLAGPLYQERSVRFLENHDEPRAAAVFPLEMHRPAAVVTFLVPGMRFFHEGQLEGRRARVSMHVTRRPEEEPDPAVRDLYRRLLPCLARPEVHAGDWRLWTCRPAWDGNRTFEDMIVFTWVEGPSRLLVAVNYAPRQGQCYVALDLDGTAGGTYELVDLLGDARYEREGDGLRESGLYLDMPPWGCHAFDMRLVRRRATSHDHARPGTERRDAGRAV